MSAPVVATSGTTGYPSIRQTVRFGPRALTGRVAASGIVWIKTVLPPIHVRRIIFTGVR